MDIRLKSQRLLNSENIFVFCENISSFKFWPPIQPAPKSNAIFVFFVKENNYGINNFVKCLEYKWKGLFVFSINDVVKLKCSLVDILYVGLMHIMIKQTCNNLYDFYFFVWWLLNHSDSSSKIVYVCHFWHFLLSRKISNYFSNPVQQLTLWVPRKR